MRWAGLVFFATSCNFSTHLERVDAPRDDGDVASCAESASWLDGKSPTREVHVGPPMGTPDGTVEHPYATISAALSAGLVTPGTKIVLAGGVHNGDAVRLPGTSEAPIWIVGRQGGTRAQFIGVGLQLMSPSYVALRDVDAHATQGSAPGINVDASLGPAEYVSIEGSRVSGAPGPCFRFTNVDHVSLRDSSGESCNRGVQLIGVHHASVARVSVHTMVETGVHVAGGSSDIEIRDSRFSDTGNRVLWIGGESSVSEFRPALSAAGDNFEARDVRVFNNVMQVTGGNTAILCSTCKGALIAHNLLLDGRTLDAVFGVERRDPEAGFPFGEPGDVRYLDNAIELQDVTEAISYTGDVARSSLAFAHNLWSPMAKADVVLPTEEVGGIYNERSGYMTDGRLCASTGARVAGAGRKVPEVPGTIDGTCRPDPPSIGPSEPNPGC
ncbi:MAG: hypothetical protein ACTHU0_16895 [Kofleriaceae bacterium]